MFFIWYDWVGVWRFAYTPYACYSQHYDALENSKAGKPIGGHLFNMTKEELDREITDINQKLQEATKRPASEIHEFVRDAYALREKLFQFSKTSSRGCE